MKTLSISLNTNLKMEIMSSYFRKNQSTLVTELLNKLWQENEHDILKKVLQSFIEGKIRQIVLEFSTEKYHGIKSRIREYPDPSPTSRLLLETNDDD
jgi:hypothetical protein